MVHQNGIQAWKMQPASTDVIHKKINNIWKKLVCQTLGKDSF